MNNQDREETDSADPREPEAKDTQDFEEAQEGMVFNDNESSISAEGKEEPLFDRDSAIPEIQPVSEQQEYKRIFGGGEETQISNKVFEAGLAKYNALMEDSQTQKTEEWEERGNSQQSGSNVSPQPLVFSKKSKQTSYGEGAKSIGEEYAPFEYPEDNEYGQYSKMSGSKIKTQENLGIKLNEAAGVDPGSRKAISNIESGEVKKKKKSGKNLQEIPVFSVSSDQKPRPFSTFADHIGPTPTSVPQSTKERSVPEPGLNEEDGLDRGNNYRKNSNKERLSENLRSYRTTGGTSKKEGMNILVNEDPVLNQEDTKKLSPEFKHQVPSAITLPPSNPSNTTQSPPIDTLLSQQKTATLGGPIPPSLPPRNFEACRRLRQSKEFVSIGDKVIIREATGTDSFQKRGEGEEGEGFERGGGEYRTPGKSLRGEGLGDAGRVDELPIVYWAREPYRQSPPKLLLKIKKRNKNGPNRNRQKIGKVYLEETKPVVKREYENVFDRLYYN